MGYIKHNAIIVTGSTYAEEMFLSVHQRARELFGALTSEFIITTTNGFLSFFVAPDGSKEGWDESERGDEKRKLLADFIDSLAYDDGSNAIKFVDVSYDEQHKTNVERTNRPITGMD